MEKNIQDNNGDYFQLSKLVELILNQSDWNITRNTIKSIPIVKKYADLAAHNRRFSALKSDIDKMRDDLRIVVSYRLLI